MNRLTRREIQPTDAKEVFSIGGISSASTVRLQAAILGECGKELCFLINTAVMAILGSLSRSPCLFNRYFRPIIGQNAHIVLSFQGRKELVLP